MRGRRRGRALAILFSTVVAVGGGAVAASGAGPGGQAMPQQDPKWNGADKREFRQQLADQRIAEDRRRAERQRPEARAERRRSRTAYRGMARQEARQLAQQTFPNVYRAKPWKAAGPGKGERLDRYAGRYGAVIAEDGEDKGTKLLMSTHPLVTENADGDLRPTDTEIVEHADHFAPRNPLVEAEIGDQVGEGVTFPERKLGLRPLGLTDTTAPSTLGQTLTWTNVDADTDFSLTSTPNGVETFHVLRSEASPERLPFELDLQEGDRVVAVPESQGALEVRRGDTVVATISTPIATAADGESVAVTVEHDDDGFTLVVPHREKDVAYPILVDPTMAVAIPQQPFTDSSIYFKGWSYESMGPWHEIQRSDNFFGTRGLWLWNNANYYYGDGFWGLWKFTAPRETFISQASLSYMGFLNQGAGMCVAEGLWYNGAWANSWWQSPAGGQTGGVPWSYCGNSYSNETRNYFFSPPVQRSNSVAAMMYAYGPGTRNSQNLMNVGGATVTINDDAPPAYLGASGLTENVWTAAPAQQLLKVDAVDNGLGMQSVLLDSSVNGAAATRIANYLTGCDDNYVANPRTPELSCPQRITPEFTINNVEGTTNYVLYALDAFDQYQKREFSTRIDRTAPKAPTLTEPSPATKRIERGKKASVRVGTDDRTIPGPQSASLPGSGVRKVVVTATKAGTSTKYETTIERDAATCAAANNFGGCAPDFSQTAEFDTTSWSTGAYEITAVATDALGTQSALSAAMTLTVTDETAPVLQVRGGLRTSPYALGRDLAAKATDAESGVTRVDLWVAPVTDGRLTASGVVPTGTPTATAPCPAGSTCAGTDGVSLPYTLPSSYGPGRYELTVQAVNGAGKTTNEQWLVEIVALRSGDRSKLGLEEWFDLDETDVGGEQSVFVNGETGNVVWHAVPAVNPGRGLSTAVNLTYNSQERAGVLGGILGRIPVLGHASDTSDVLGNDLGGVAYDQAGQGFSLGIGGPTRVNEPLAGAVAAAAVERSLVGTSTQWPSDRAQLVSRLAGLSNAATAVDAAGTMRISLTDADGTRHTFMRRLGESAWSTPAGLNMRLRFIGPRGQGTTPAPGLLNGTQLADPANFAWELLRPDGVRHRFDQLGYLRQTIDRNNNVLTYVYDAVNAATGQLCTATDAVGKVLENLLCYPRLKEVRQPTYGADVASTPGDESARKVVLAYTSTATTIDKLLSKVFAFDVGTIVADASTLGQRERVSAITDAAGRVYRLTYAGGRLTQLREADGDPGARITSFRYSEPAGTIADPCAAGITPATPGTGDVNQLTSVVPVTRNAQGQEQERPATCIAYQSRTAGSLTAPPAPRRVARIVKRGGAQKLFRYQAMRPGQSPATFATYEQTTGTRYLTRADELDDQGRPVVVRESTSTLADLNAAATPVASQGSTETRLEWTTDHKVAKVVEENGDHDRTTTLHYDAANGVLEDRTIELAGDGRAEDRVRSWDFGYDEPGKPAAGEPGFSPDDAFIADLDKIEQPGKRTWTFEPDPTTGNVGATTTPAGVRMETRYGTGGVVTGEQDEMGRWTTFSDFDSGGLPTKVSEPGQNAQDQDAPRVSGYRYDALGNPTHVIDPRGTLADLAGAGDAPYKTRLTYDAFSRLTKERVPRLSATSDYDASKDGARFVERLRTFDRNGNVAEVTDAAQKHTRMSYDEDGTLVGVDRPGATDTAREVTRFVNDGAQRPIAEARPMATWQGTIATDIASEQVAACEDQTHDVRRTWVTRWCLDHRGQPLAEVQTSALTGDLARRITSYAYDAFGNVAGVADANRNTTTVNAGMSTERQDPVPVPEAVLNAADPVDQRMRFAYDVMDRRVLAVEHPRGGDRAGDREQRWTFNSTDDLAKVAVENGDADRESSFTYDAMGRQLTQTDPLGRITCLRRQADGLVTSMTSPRGVTDVSACASPVAAEALFTTKMTYDAAGFLRKRTVPWDGKKYGGRTHADDWFVTYEPDAVGNPVAITDARGAKHKPADGPNPHRFVNTFLDTGELRSTERPSWWQVSWGGGQPNPSGGDAADTEVAVGGPVVGERGGRSANALASGLLPDKPDTLGKGDGGEGDRAALPAWLPPSGLTKLRYDAENRLTEIVDPPRDLPSTATPDPETTKRIGYDAAGRVTIKSWQKNRCTRDVQNGCTATDLIDHDFGYDANGNLTASGEDWTDALDVDTTFTYDGYDRRLTQKTEGARPDDAQSDPEAETTGFVYDANDNLRFLRSPRGMQAGSGYRTGYAYDSLDQLRTETNPVGLTSTYDYNRLGELTKDVAPHDPATPESLYTTTSAYDAGGQLVSRTRPVDIRDIDPNTDGEQPGLHTLTWEFGYDADGNRERTEKPGAPDRQVTEVVHDARGLPWRTTLMGDDGGPNDRRTTFTEYDANGNLRRSVRPAGTALDAETSQLAPIARDDGTNDETNVKAAAENAHVSTYDTNDLLVQEWLPWRGADDVKYVRRWERQRAVDGRGYVTQIQRPRKAGAETDERTDFTYNAAGWITGSVEHLKLDPDEPDVTKPAASVSYQYDQRGQQTQWSLKPKADDESRRKINWTYWPNGRLKQRTGTVTPRADDGDAATKLTYRYFYNRNRSLVRLEDPDVRSADGNQRRTTLFTRDAAERETEIDETEYDANGAPRESNDARHNDVELQYDAWTGDLVRRRTDGFFTTASGGGRQYAGGDRRSTSFEYDALGRETQMTVDPTAANGDDTGGDKPDRVTRTAWFDGGQMQERTRPTKTVERWTWNVLGEKASRRRAPKSGSAQTQHYAYDVNGNRTLDERGGLTEPSASAGSYLQYNARDQLVYWRRPDDPDRRRRGWVTRYAVDETGALELKAECNPKTTGDCDYKTPAAFEDTSLLDEPADKNAPNGPTNLEDIEAHSRIVTDPVLRGGRIDEVQTLDKTQAPGHEIKIRQSYRYDRAGNVQRVYTDASAEDLPVTLGKPDQAEKESTTTCRTADATTDPTASERKRVTRYCYDEFNRTRFSSGYGESDAKEISYDGLDRRDRTKELKPGGAERQLTYLGSTELLAREAPVGGAGTRMAFDYDSRGDRVGLQSSNGGRFYAYDKDANGSVLGLEEDGDDPKTPGTTEVEGQITKGKSYAYDPYGALDVDDDLKNTSSSDTTRFGMDEGAAENPFRFEGFYSDSSTDSYDMHARGYSPGGAQFLSRDAYASAAGDFALSADLLTQNRYAFGGGNPVSNVEFDGHALCAKAGECGGQASKVNGNAAAGAAGRPAPNKITPKGSNGNDPDSPYKYHGNAQADVAAAKAGAAHDRRVDAANAAAREHNRQLEIKADPKTKVEHFADGAVAGVTETFDAVTNPGETIDGLTYAAQNPGAAATAFVHSCDGKTVSECGGYAFSAVVGAKGTTELVRGATGVVRGGRAPTTRTRLPQDLAANGRAPRALATTRPVGRASHNRALQNDIAGLPLGTSDIRVNQQQVNGQGERVGINRPDLQYTTPDGQRHYVEYEGPDNPRGDAHRERILANDPTGKFSLRLVR